MNEVAQLILNRYDAADKYLEKKRTKWDDYEKLFNNELQDSVSALTKSDIFDPVLSTMQIERSNRVMAQLQTGKFRAMSKNDEASNKLMNLTIEKYVLPNATSQFDFLTKCRMIDLYSNTYGNFFAFIDWVAKDEGYVGPDMWLINIRDIFPQVGAVSLEDSDYVIVRSWKTIEYFKSIKNVGEFKNVDKVIERFEEMGGEKSSRSYYKDQSSREAHEYNDAVEAKKSGFFQIISMYERDRWVDYVPGADTVIRDMDNPNDDGELPVVCKYSLPLLDDFMGMGDSERGMSQQMFLNGLWNLYAGAIKMSIFPPVMLDKNGISAMNSIKWGPAEKWLGKNANFAQVLNLTPQGTNTFNNVHQALLGSLQQQFGTTFTNTAQGENSQMGKTPQALKMQAAREGSRDSADRFYMESFLTKVMKRFATLITKKQPKALQIRLFKDEIDELFAQYPDFKDMYDEKTGKIKIGKSQFKNILFDYEIVSGSTYVADKEEQQANLTSLLQMLIQNMQANPQTGEVTSPMIERLKSEGKETLLSELITRILSNSGVQGWDKILPDLTGGDPQAYKTQQVLKQNQQQLDMALQQMMQPSMNQIPLEQGMQPEMGMPQGGMPSQGMPEGMPQGMM